MSNVELNFTLEEYQQRIAKTRAAMQREVVKRFSNVSAIDLTLVIQTLDTILDRVSFVIQFMAMFTPVPFREYQSRMQPGEEQD